MKLKLNRNLSTPQGKLLKDAIIEIAADENSIPLDLFWRSRLLDSVIDNCVEIVSETLKSKK
jgi:hypothetical protein